MAPSFPIFSQVCTWAPQWLDRWKVQRVECSASAALCKCTLQVSVMLIQLITTRGLVWNHSELWIVWMLTSWHFMGTPGIGEEPSPDGEGVSENGQQVVPDCTCSYAFSALQGQGVYRKAVTWSRAYVCEAGTQWTLGAASDCCFWFILFLCFCRFCLDCSKSFSGIFHCHYSCVATGFAWVCSPFQIKALLCSSSLGSTWHCWTSICRRWRSLRKMTKMRRLRRQPRMSRMCQCPLIALMLLMHIDVEKRYVWNHRKTPGSCQFWERQFLILAILDQHFSISAIYSDVFQESKSGKAGKV